MLVPKNNTGKRKEPPNAPTISKSKVPKVLENSMKKTLAIGSSTSSSNEIERGNDKNNESLEAGEIRQFTIRKRRLNCPKSMGSAILMSCSQIPINLMHCPSKRT